MNQLPETIACPYCGNINPFLQENCIKCKKPLGPIRAAMQSGTGVEQPEQTQTPQKPIEPAPPMPDLPKGSIDNINFLDRNSFLIRGVGSRNLEVAARFFKRLGEKDLKSVSLSAGELRVDVGTEHQESRDYYFVRKDLDERTYLLMAIRIAPVGPDLYVEWRHYYYRKPAHYNGWWWLYIPFWGGVVYTMFFYNADDKLKGFQHQENEMFQLSIRATLEEAIDLAGISKSLIQKEGDKDRVI